MDAPTRCIGCHPFTYTEDKMSMQNRAVPLKILTKPSTVCTFSDYVERCIRQATAKRKISSDYI